MKETEYMIPRFSVNAFWEPRNNIADHSRRVEQVRLVVSMRKFKVFILMSILVCAACIGCSDLVNTEENTEVAVSFPDGQRLRLDISIGPKKGFISSDKENYIENCISYTDITDMFIEIEGQKIELRDAIEQDIITPDELEAYAKVDAKRGFCIMEYVSKNGFAQYMYRYEKFTLLSNYDVIEAANGECYHYQHLAIVPPNNYTPAAYGFPTVQINGELKDIEREDWGVLFEVIEATPVSVTLRCTQSGGQHIGQLQMEDFYTLYRVESNGSCECYYEKTALSSPAVDVAIDNGGITEFLIIWPDECGKLPCGEYELAFYLRDVYEKMPSLMRNYTDQQLYEIRFSITEYGGAVFD